MNTTIICQRCHCTIPDEDVIIFDDTTLCQDCYESETAICDECGERIWRADSEADENMILCSHCYEYNYTRCENCNSLIRNDQAYYTDDDEDTPLCESCYNARQNKRCIQSYYYKPDPIFYGYGNRFFGVELEIDDAGETNCNAKRLHRIASQEKEYIYIKHDGSLSDGMELVSHPASLEAHLNDLPWHELMREAIHMGYHSHQSSSCGLHVHINRNSFGTTISEQDACIARILFFVENHWNEILKFSRRTQRQMDRWAARYGRKDSPKEVLDIAQKSNYGRYTCVNLTNEDTIEFRMFRGTLRWDTFAATLQFVYEICRVAEFLSDEEMGRLSWCDFVGQLEGVPQLVQYLKERNLYVNEPITAETEV